MSLKMLTGKITVHSSFDKKTIQPHCGTIFCCFWDNAIYTKQKILIRTFKNTPWPHTVNIKPMLSIDLLRLGQGELLQQPSPDITLQIFQLIQL